MKQRFRLLLTTALTLTCIPAAAWAQADASKFPLSKIIPDDVFLAVAAKENGERKFLNAYWGDVMKAFHESGVMTDVWDLLTDAMAVDDEKLDEVETAIDRFSELSEKIDWNKLFDKEMVYCGRFTPRFNTPGFHEGLFAGRSDADSAGKNFGNLKRLMAELIKYINTKAEDDVLKLVESETKGAKCASLTIAQGAEFAITIANKDDVTFITFGGTTLLDDALDLLAGKGEKKPLVETTRYKGAIAQLPAAEDSLVFFDAERMMSTFRNMFDQIQKMQSAAAHAQAGADAEGDEADSSEGEGDDAAGPLKIVSKILNDISIFDYIVTSEHTDGYRVLTDRVTMLRPNAKESPLYAIVTSGKPNKDFARFIPKEAASFGVSSGLNVNLIYKYIIGIVRNDVPDGEAMLAQWEQLQKEHLQLDLEKDVLSLFEGSSFHFQVDDQWVLAVKVTDEKKAQEQFDRLIKTINGMMGDNNSLMTSKVRVGEKIEFTQISHPMMMMMGGMSPPVIGCAESYMMVGSSAEVVKTCIKTASGDHPNITSNPRWKEEALRPDGTVVAIAFTDQANMAKELQAGLGAASMGLGMAGMMGGGDMPKGMRNIMTGLPPILVKLGTVAGTLNFYKSHATYESFDGNKWTGREVQNYKSPTEREPVETATPKPSSDGDHHDAVDHDDDDSDGDSGDE